jgi:hypothetical protein
VWHGIATGIGVRARTRSITIHMAIETIDLRYATSVRAFGPDKKPQFLERLLRL